MKWLDRASCRYVGEWLFFPPDDGHDNAPTRVKQARQVCGTCPVWRECRLVSLGETDGVWSGITALERQRLRVDLGLTEQGKSSYSPMTELSGLEKFVRKTRQRLSSVRDDVDEMLQTYHPEWFKLPVFHVYEVRDGLTTFRIGA